VASTEPQAEADPADTDPTILSQLPDDEVSQPAVLSTAAPKRPHLRAVSSMRGRRHSLPSPTMTSSKNLGEAAKEMAQEDRFPDFAAMATVWVGVHMCVSDVLCLALD
jgi:hypothetical protein